jgi:hypothetical protein
MFEMLTDKL